MRKIVFDKNKGKQYNEYEIQLPDTWSDNHCKQFLMTMREGLTPEGKRRSWDFLGEKFQPSIDKSAKLLV